MKLRTVRIQNFRSFRDETIHFDNYTCLVGPNGGGKSNILTGLCHPVHRAGAVYLWEVLYENRTNINAQS